MKEISREQVMLWCMDAGFTTVEVRTEITKFEKIARHVAWFCSKEDNDNKGGEHGKEEDNT